MVQRQAPEAPFFSGGSPVAANQKLFTATRGGSRVSRRVSARPRPSNKPAHKPDLVVSKAEQGPRPELCALRELERHLGWWHMPWEHNIIFVVIIVGVVAWRPDLHADAPGQCGRSWRREHSG